MGRASAVHRSLGFSSAEGRGRAKFLLSMAAPRKLMILAGRSQTLPNQRDGLLTASPGQTWAAAHVCINGFQLCGAMLAKSPHY